MDQHPNLLFLLGLLWWAMFVEHLSQTRAWRKSVVTLLHVLGWLLTPLFNISSFLFGLLSHGSASQPSQGVHPGRSPLQGPQGPHTLPPELVTIGRWVFLALLFLLVLLVVRKSVQRWSRNDEEKSIEEERETVDARSAFRERW